MQFLFVSPNVCRQLLSDSPSRRTPLLLANTPYCKAHSGLTPYSLYPCLTHKAKPALGAGFWVMLVGAHGFEPLTLCL